MSIRPRFGYEMTLAIVTLLVLAALSTMSDKFLTTSNLLNQGRLMSEVGLVALAMTFVIITGGIDLSVGSILGLTAILLGVFWQSVGLPLPVAALAAMACGTAAGFMNGLIITRFGVPPLITTLATLALYRGLAEGISNARSVRGYPEWFYWLGQGNFAGVPSQLWILVLCTIVATVILALTPFGRATYAIGANETAARFSGVRVVSTKLWIYSAAGFLSALAAVIFVSRVTTTRSDMGTGIELDVITGVVLGGTSIFGGKGTIPGTVLGLVLIQALKNGLSLSGVKGDGTIVIIGVVLIGAMLIGAMLDRNRGGS
jgi:rhamnose transport system permease protein